MKGRKSFAKLYEKNKTQKVVGKPPLTGSTRLYSMTISQVGPKTHDLVKDPNLRKNHSPILHGLARQVGTKTHRLVKDQYLQKDHSLESQPGTKNRTPAFNFSSTLTASAQLCAYVSSRMENKSLTHDPTPTTADVAKWCCFFKGFNFYTVVSHCRYSKLYQLKYLTSKIILGLSTLLDHAITTHY